MNPNELTLTICLQMISSITISVSAESKAHEVLLQNDILQQLLAEDCTMIVVSPNPIRERSTMYFTEIQQFMEVTSLNKFINITASKPCLTVLASTANLTEASSLIDHIGNLPGPVIKNRRKYLLLMASDADFDQLQNKSINFNVHIISSRISKAGAVISNAPYHNNLQ